MIHLGRTGGYAFRLLAALVLVVAPAAAGSTAGQGVQVDGGSDPNVTVAPGFFQGMSWRPTGFSRGGRSTAVSGVPGEPLTYLAGYSGGGVWKTTDAGLSWENLSDGHFNVGSIGDIKVAPSDPNVIYVGTGSGCPRGNVSTGDGIYKSTDGGDTWEHVWDPGYVLIPEMQVHPQDPERVYAAVLGDIFGPNEARGIYRTEDGGGTWEKVLHVSERTGFNDVEMHPTNPRILFASAWTVVRKPWTIDSGSEEAGIWKSKDGGDTWQKLSGGLPDGMVGKIDVTISPPMPDRMWAMIEAPEPRGGVYRSDDGGDSWRRINTDRSLQQRAWYYTHIYADPADPATVYALNVGFYKSTDGGRDFDTRLRPRHGDNHDLWLNPDNPDFMVNANDGGANVSLDGGGSFSEQMNQPTAEFYRVTVDDRFPYNIYGAQQDNSTAAVTARGGEPVGLEGGYSVGGGESGHIAVHPNGEVVYAGSYGGSITRVDLERRLRRSIRTYADAPTGQPPRDLKYRFQWNAPIRISPHDPSVVYHTSQYVHRTTDGGRTWEVISPDLTTDDETRQDFSGSGGITRDNTGVEVYTTVFAFEESPHAAGLLWAGSDDGLVHVSRDDGVTWDEVTPAGMPAGGTVNMIDLSAHGPGRAHIAVHRYREQDYRPYVFRTVDYGATWTLLTDGTNGIPANEFVRVVREDPNRAGLLYAGGEFGAYVSFDGGAHWQSLQLNLPITPVTDMVIKDDDLVVATQGRAFWVLDDVSPLHQITDEVESAAAWLFEPRPAYRGDGPDPWIHYWLAEAPGSPVEMEVLDASGEVVRSFTARPGVPGRFTPFGGGRLSAWPGLNTFAWDGELEGGYEVPRGILQWGGGRGRPPPAPPGAYTFRMSIGDWSREVTLDYRKDPRLPTTRAEYEEQVRFAREVGEEAGRLYRQLRQLRSVKEQVMEIGERLQEAGHGREALEMARQIHRELTDVEGELTQLEGESAQDALNYPGRLDNQYNALYSEIVGTDWPVAGGAYERWEDLRGSLAPHIEAIRAIYDTELAEFNQLVEGLEVGPVIMPDSGPGR